ncbi:MAG: TlyA family RNA methyltransferase [Proteobacteria bacterium]|nr:TlyA family RNA methyltransferase [Pseudomonadota bacterium]
MTAERPSRRLDEELVARGLVPSRARAKEAIENGQVMVNGATARKPSQAVVPAADIAIDDLATRYVSRAAWKLVHGLDHFGIDVKGRHCLDLGASTGGFTQVLLERAAAHVTAIDVGHGQMDRALAGDARVTLREGINARHLTPGDMPDDVSLIVCDVSFISLKLALPPVLGLAHPGTRLLALIKPQFEVGKDALGKGGIVRDPALQNRVCLDISDFILQSGWWVLGFTPSPISGGDGNQEFLIAAGRT